MKTLTVVPQYRSNSFSPVLWDVAHVWKDGLNTITEVVAENCEKQDATLFSAAPELLLELEKCSAQLESLVGLISRHLAYDFSYSQGLIESSSAAIAKAKGGAA